MNATTATRLARGAGRLALAYAAAIVIFGAFTLTKGANPVQMYSDMVRSTADSTSFAQILIKAAPLILAGLAVAVPARAGLVNVGGEGQVIVGAIAAAGVALALGSTVPGGPMIVLMVVASAAAGAIWAGIAAVLRLTVKINEAITTLLLNYVALDLFLYLIYQPWKDPHGSGQPASRPLEVAARLPLVGTSRVHAGIFISLVATAAVFALFKWTSWGFRLRVVGGNAEAARRAGLPVAGLLLSAMLVGGALAGLGGMVHFAGAEFKLRPGMTMNFGYIAFLASWLARHHPVKVAGAAVLLATIAIAGDSLQVDSSLPAAAVNVLMGLVLIAVMARGKPKVPTVKVLVAPQDTATPTPAVAA